MSLPSLDAREFAAVFEAVHGVPPFPWQRRLLERIARGEGWPEALDLPTGSGKTAAIDVALFHLALQADGGARREAPVRIAFVVDRRIIVDAAADRAERIARALDQAEGDTPLARMAARLRHLAGAEALPLLVRRLRGGLPREADWARTPGQPTILCSTVDQVGSRLLFRGYGVSDSMSPVHAGLLGSDCLFLLDEAHLAAPFAQTLRRIAAYRAPPWCERAPGPWSVVSLSATQEPRGAAFGLDEADRAHPVLRSRLDAPKPAELRLLPATSVKEAETDGRASARVAARSARATVEAFADAAKALLDGSARSSVAVVVNRVALARAVWQQLDEQLGDAAEVVLLTGRIRELDRKEMLDQVVPRLAIGAERGAKPLVIVATQTIEAGADFDVDALVTQAAPLDALRQRFGRLNRAGRDIAARGVIIATKDEVAKNASDPVYGDRTAKTWAWLNDKAAKPARKADAPVLDFGIAAMERLLAAETEAALNLSTDKPRAPILRPADLLLLSWTAPVPAVDPAIALFLHGPRSAPADVSIVWRSDLSAETLDAAAAWVALAPPHAGETLTVPVWAARAWLAEQDEAAEVADLEGAGASESVADPRRSRRALRWAGEDNARTGVIVPEALQPGDVITVPALYGGCDRFGWNPSNKEAVRDLGDQRGDGQRAIRRLHPAKPGWDRVSTLLAPDEDIDDSDRLAGLVTAGIIDEPNGWRIMRPEGYAGVILVGPKRGGLVATTEDDASGLESPQPVGLPEHTKAVVAKARAFAEAAGLSPAVVGDVALAAELHDAGKGDPRFQVMLRGGDRLLAALSADVPLAKSARLPTPAAAAAARKAAGLPERWRHEAQSVTRAITDPGFAQARDRELVLWLIGTHHGFGRPLFPHDDPREAPDALGPQRLDFQFEGWDWPQLFERLKARYGPWELARLEAVLRLADHRASEEDGA
jgi:CRISPR-associated endonuclease/helicase Cas3